MLKKNIFGLLLIVFLWASPAFAYDLTLTKIGTMSTIGADYSLVSYIGAIPLLEGTATPAAQVAVTVKTTTAYVTAATASGVWQYLPAVLTTGDNAVIISSGSQRLDFVLRYNSTTPTATPSAVATISSAVTTLPQTGTWEYVVFGLVAGAGVWYLGRDVKKRMRVWEKGV
jgi:hypothetical protein